MGTLLCAMNSCSSAADYVARLHQEVMQLGGNGDWTPQALVAWLDKHIDHADIPAGESAAFLTKAVNGIMARHGITDIGLLALDRFRQVAPSRPCRDRRCLRRRSSPGTRWATEVPMG